MSNQKTFQTADFKKLNKIWRKKLKDSGFEDIEDSNEDLLLSTTTMMKASKKDYVSVTSEAKREYYYLASRFLNEYEFPNDLQKNIWRMHSDGTPHRKIMSALGTTEQKLYWTKYMSIMNDLKSRMFKLYGVTKS